MDLKNTVPIHIKTIAEFHRYRNLPGPMHSLISVLRFEDVKYNNNHLQSWVLDLYAIAIKKDFKAKLKYGQQIYDFDEGIMTFMGPGQKAGIDFSDRPVDHSGWLLLFHPDFLWETSLARHIKSYEFFEYSVNEALFLSEQEEFVINGLMQNIQMEYFHSIDHFSKIIMIGHLEILLTYANRFYQRQFITRNISNHDVLMRLDQILDSLILEEHISINGLPTVSSVAEALHISPNYLSGLLKSLTNKSTQQHIHDRVIVRAKEILSTTTISINEVAYSLGFDYPQSFSKLFKKKTNISPAEFRQSCIRRN